jgi:hypothetical protein
MQSTFSVVVERGNLELRGLGADEVRMESFDTSGGSGAGEEIARKPAMSAAVLPPSPAEAIPHAHTHRKGVFLGAVALGLLMLGAVGFLVYLMTGPESTVVPQPSAPSAEPTLVDSTPPPEAGFEFLELGNGWMRYVNEDVGFSIELPPGWHATGPLPTLSRKLEFTAAHGPAPTQEGPTVFVSRYELHEGQTPRQFFERFRLRTFPGLVRRSDLTDAQLPHGRAFVYTSAWKSKVGPLRETTYEFAHGGSAYTLTFIGLTRQMDRYEDVLLDIANTFDVTP